MCHMFFQEEKKKEEDSDDDNYGWSKISKRVQVNVHPPPSLQLLKDFFTANPQYLQMQDLFEAVFANQEFEALDLLLR